MTERSIAEIIGFDDDRDGDFLVTVEGGGHLTNLRPTVDDMLAWLRERTCPDCLILTTKCYQAWGPRVEVHCCSLRNGDDWPEIAAETIAGALELAVRAVAEGTTP